MLRAEDLPDVEIADDEEAGLVSDRGVVTSHAPDPGEFVEAFAEAVSEHRFWDRNEKELPA